MDGEVFRVNRFMNVVNEVYHRVVMQTGTETTETVALEDEMFIQMLQSQIVQLPDGQNIFRLYSGLRTDPAGQTDLLTEHEGVPFLRLPMIADSTPVEQCA